MYWTLDSRPPTLDERIIQAKARHAERVEQIAAEEPVPQLEVPNVPSHEIHVGPIFTVRPGHYFEVSEEQMRAFQERMRRAFQERMRRAAFDQMAAQQNVAFANLGGFGQHAGTRSSAAAAQRNVLADASTFGTGFYSLGYQPIIKHHPVFDTIFA